MQLAEIHFSGESEDGAGPYRLAPPTPRLAFQANRLFGGVGVLVDRCQAGDLDVFAGILKLACPEIARMKEADREAFVYANLREVSLACTRWAVALQWGGREPHQVIAEQEKRALDGGADDETGAAGGDAGGDGLADPEAGNGAAGAGAGG